MANKAIAVNGEPCDMLHSENGYRSRISPAFFNVIETIFCPLPNESKARKKEQDSRRKYKEKIIEKYPEYLIVDSICHTINDIEEVQYTNTILVTEAIDWWKNSVQEFFKDIYTEEQKDLSCGNQVTWRDSNGDKFLTFSFYPTKHKMMVQGNHHDVKVWIKHFQSLAETKNKATAAPINCEHGVNIPEAHKGDDAKAGDHVINHQAHDVKSKEAAIATCQQELEGNGTNGCTDEPSPVSAGEMGAMAPVTTANHEAGTDKEDEEAAKHESVLFYTPGTPDITLDKLTTCDEESFNSSMTATSMNNGVPQHRRRSSRFIIKSATCTRDSQRLVQIKSRLDVLDGVLAGLQGGILQVVETVQEHRLKTDEAITRLTDLSQQILQKLAKESPQSKVDGNKNAISSKEINQVKDSVCQLQNTVLKKITTLAEQVNHLESDIQKSAEIQKRVKDDIIESIHSENVKATSTVSSEIESHTRSINSQFQRMEVNVSKLSKTESAVTGTHLHHQGSVTVASRSASEASTKVPLPRRECSPNRGSNERRNTPNRHDSQSQRGENVSNRKVLLMGDSTIKHIDKRRVLRDQMISKCRVSTVSEANYKIVSDSNHTMEKIVFCVGLNDLRNGNSATQVRDDVEHLIYETKRRHPGCKILLCSILPIKCTEEMKRRIKQTNAHLAQLAAGKDLVYYVDILSEFVSHKFMQELFESDLIHPNTKGTLVMAVCIRHSLQHDHKLRKTFTSKPVNIDEMSYASCTSRTIGHDQSSRDVGAKSAVNRAPPGAYPFQSRQMPIWWPGNCYPPMMPPYLSGMPAAYPQMYPVPGDERVSF